MIYKLKRNIPNIITISRIVSLILGFVFFIKNKIILSLIFYIYGAVSDALDGYFARKLSAYSKLGQYLDAISDKLYFLSLIIILLIYKYYLIVIPLIIESIISVINYLILKKNKKVFTERVGKFKTTLLIIDLILGIISIKIKEIIYPHIIILLLVLYFEFQTVFAYINQLNNKSKEKIVSFKEKNVIERIKLLLEEFIYYIKKPITIK
ncbi:MAG: CDP-alcohol phosphatidyltransferase family protein [Bacilli bacterium]|nr:CDP-alcohol phosphatidyltransferase family protein [Bacilli bacterium]